MTPIEPMGALTTPAVLTSPEMDALGAGSRPKAPKRVNGSSQMDVYEIDPLQDPRWTELVENHGRASLFHDKRWLQALQTAYGYGCIVVSTCPPHAPLTNGLVFCRVKSWLTGTRLVSLPFSDHCEPLVENSDALDRLLLHTRGSVEDGRAKYMEIRPIGSVPGDATGLAKTKAYFLQRLDLRKSAQELFCGFHRDCVQRKIRRSERECLEYDEGNSEELLKNFYGLLVMTRRRQHLPPQPISWFRSLIAAFDTDLKIRVASKNGVPIASILTIHHKNVVTYKYGCSDARHHKLGGMVFLFWKTIQEAKDKGYEELDMGRSDTDNPGLVAFKSHWGSTCSVLNYWQYPSSVTGLQSPWKMKLLTNLVSIAPDASLIAAGNLLYRHIG